MGAGLAIDGKMNTRCQHPDHNPGGWFELNWADPVAGRGVIVFQHDRYVTEMASRPGYHQPGLGDATALAIRPTAPQNRRLPIPLAQDHSSPAGEYHEWPEFYGSAGL